MDEELKRRLNNEEYKNWLKVSIALLQSKEALHDFTKEVIENVHEDIQRRTASSCCVGSCKTNKGKAPNCSSCLLWVKEIKWYNKGKLNWKNTDPKKWHSEPWEIAKCFMNAQGSNATAALNTGPEKTDLSGILNVVINCKEFAGNYLKTKNAPETVRQIRNKVMHSSEMRFTDVEMKDCVKSIIDLLEDEKQLKGLEICKEKVRIIKSLRDGQFDIYGEVEVDCIEDLLRCYKHIGEDVEFGEDVDTGTQQSLEKLSQFIKSNKDLQAKFESKLSQISDHFQNITDNLDARISFCEISEGELRGKIEYLETQISQIQKLPGPLNAVNHEKCLLKNALQCYAQKKKLDLPKYTFEKTVSGEFLCIVSVGDKVFKSSNTKPSKKEAEQCAAEMALTFFRNEVSENNSSSEHISQGTSPISTVLRNEQARDKIKSYKNLLQEYAQKEKTILPIYDTKQKDDGTFSSTVFFNGVWFSPDTVPQLKKIDAEQNAAQFVLACLKNEICKTFCDNTKCVDPKKEMFANQKHPAEINEGLSDDPNIRNISVPEPENSTPKATQKPYKSILNEYCQKSNITNSPDYETNTTTDGKLFISTVTVNGNVYKNEFPKNSKKQSEDHAAMIACLQLNLTCTNDSVSYQLNDHVSDENKIHVESTVVDGNKPFELQNKVRIQESNDEMTGEDISDECKIEISVSITSPPKNARKSLSYKSILNEYCQKLDNVNPPEYETKETTEGRMFDSSVTVNGNVYKNQLPKTSKKLSEENAAMIACSQLSLSCIGDTASSQSNDLIVQENNIQAHSTSVDKTKHAEPQNKFEDKECHAEMTNDNHSADRKTPVSASVADSPPRSTKISYKSMLNEYCQKLDNVNPPEYETEETNEKMFVSSVRVSGKVYKSELPKTSKKQSEENAAMIACSQLPYESASVTSQLNDHIVDENRIIQVESALVDDTKRVEPENTFENAEMINEAFSADCKVPISATGNIPTNFPVTNYKGRLSQYAQESKIVPRYVTKAGEGSLGFFSRVFLGKRCFKGENANKIKVAEHNAAKAAIEELTMSTKSGTACHCEKLIQEYHENLNDNFTTLPNYDLIVSSDNEKFCVLVTIAKKWKISVNEARPGKKDVEKALAELALRDLDEVGKPVPSAGDKSVASRFYEFYQQQKGVPRPKYNVIEKDIGYSGDLLFYTVEEYESLFPQLSEKEARASAAMSACNDLCLL